ncbi:uncharacterized protein BJ171DRAFT_15401 [Polychytrium aggregatum]|uniref:uncharacterized protein n=1 Tax=Polychytrium aggregatum TaxID=110093 RepID=UPI0022FF2A23|nr:uncharacterized protein BJ171DRAFT_15401 [Polychytrium aggregatum]KAI9206609.1 hypothetical protein BJ171DRAFT_15401 [Polychytrium aggregatum]
MMGAPEFVAWTIFFFPFDPALSVAFDTQCFGLGAVCLSCFLLVLSLRFYLSLALLLCSPRLCELDSSGTVVQRSTATIPEFAFLSPSLPRHFSPCSMVTPLSLPRTGSILTLIRISAGGWTHADGGESGR